MDLIKQIHKSATSKTYNNELTRGVSSFDLIIWGLRFIRTRLFNVSKFCFVPEEFLHEAQQFSQITPLEVDILFRLAEQRHSDG